MSHLDTLWVRHGESTWNRAGLMQGQTAWPPLTPAGVRQGHSAATELAKHGATALVSSDLERAAQTARIIGERLKLPVEHHALLRERHWGVFEGEPVSDGQRAEARLSAEQALPQGESRADVTRRLRRWLSSLTVPSGPVVVVTHGDVICEAVALWAPSAAISVPANGCVIEISIPISEEQIEQCVRRQTADDAERQALPFP